MISIAELPIEWQADRLAFAEKFVCNPDTAPALSIEFYDSLPECHSVQYTDLDSDSEHFLRSWCGDIIFADKKWKTAKSYYLSSADKDYALPLAAICSRFSYFNALLFHASFVKFKNKGILFTGYSGVGKTTQAELWARYVDAQIVNGDKAFIREVDDVFSAYGLPWKGSSPYCLNEKAQLGGIVILRKSEENHITRLVDNAAEMLMPHIFLPHWDEKCLDHALDTFDSLIRKVPVWLLECRPDEEAVKITHDAIFG